MIPIKLTVHENHVTTSVEINHYNGNVDYYIRSGATFFDEAMERCTSYEESSRFIRESERENHPPTEPYLVEFEGVFILEGRKDGENFIVDSARYVHPSKGSISIIYAFTSQMSPMILSNIRKTLLEKDVAKLNTIFKTLANVGDKNS